MFMCMATKTITIMDDAYLLLARKKLNNESFSDTLRRILSRDKKGIMEFAGAWKDMSDKDAENLYSNIKKVRKRLISGVIKRSM